MNAGIMKQRNAGILLPLFSLPSAFGIGDLGPEVNKFADFLQKSGQTYWQLLPLNPTELKSGHSPYSSISSMAGNILYISPELLAEEGLLDKEKLTASQIPFTQYIDYAHVEAIKSKLFDEAYHNFCKGTFPIHEKNFEIFCQKEAGWLDDFALYVTLKNSTNNTPWYEWPQTYKDRNADALNALLQTHLAEVTKIKWLQYIFFAQWQAAKSYCNEKGIKIFGDLSFYVSYDSADVWANPPLFKLDKNGAMTAIAGVPPDYFSATGQLWNMPIYNWKQMKATNYSWWIDRLKKNLELFDVLRLDHFRAFASYWEVPAGEETAINGKWIKGPGKGFFDAVKKVLGTLPFVAEDLGLDLDDVYTLRDQLGMPGMRVLQFAWGGCMPSSVHIPHNYSPNSIVYTGTHDNNTTRGWFKTETHDIQEQVKEYTGMHVHEGNAHEVMWRMAYASSAQTAILPIQDVLGLDEHAKINTPGKPDGNWQWRLAPDALNYWVEMHLLTWAKMYNR